MAEHKWPREAVRWSGASVGECSASLWAYTETCNRDMAFVLTEGPAAILVECERPYHFDRTGATEGGAPVPSAYAIPIPLEAFPDLIQRMQFAMARALAAPSPEGGSAAAHTEPRG